MGDAPELNPFSDVPFWYQRNRGFWVISKFGDFFWLIQELPR